MQHSVPHYPRIIIPVARGSKWAISEINISARELAELAGVRSEHGFRTTIGRGVARAVVYRAVTSARDVTCTVS